MSRALNKLSDTQLRKINGTPAPKTTFLNDGGNLSVRHSTSGLLTWYFTYRAGAGRQVSPERLKLGNYPDLSLKAAREKAAQCRAWLAEGKNPRHELNYSIQEALKPVTVGDAISYWLEMHVKENRVDYVSLKSRLNNHVIQHIGNMPLDKCELRHWLACFDRMPGRTDPMKPHITEKDGALWYVEPIPNTRAEELNHKETWLSDRMRTAGNHYASRINNLAGYLVSGKREDGKPEYHIIPSVFDGEILCGISRNFGCQALEEAGMLVCAEPGRWTSKTVKINGTQQRFIVLIDQAEDE